MTRPSRAPLAAALLVALLAAVPAAADPGGRSTLSETIRPGSGAYKPLVSRSGEAYVVRRLGAAAPSRSRAARRRSLAFFGQLADPQLADEMSPARVELFDPADGPISAAW